MQDFYLIEHSCFWQCIIPRVSIINDKYALFLVLVQLLVLLSKIEGTPLHVIFPDAESFSQLLSLLLAGLCHLVCSPEVKGVAVNHVRQIYIQSHFLLIIC